MFPSRQFCDRYFAPRYFPKVGADDVTTPGRIEYTVPNNRLEYTQPLGLLAYTMPKTVEEYEVNTP